MRVASSCRVCLFHLVFLTLVFLNPYPSAFLNSNPRRTRSLSPQCKFRPAAVFAVMGQQ